MTKFRNDHPFTFFVTAECLAIHSTHEYTSEDIIYFVHSENPSEKARVVEEFVHVAPRMGRMKTGLVKLITDRSKEEIAAKKATALLVRSYFGSGPIASSWKTFEDIHETMKNKASCMALAVEMLVIPKLPTIEEFNVVFQGKHPPLVPNKRT